MDAASVELVDLDGLSVEQLKAMLHEQHAQLAVKDAQILNYTAHIEALKLLILKLRQMQFGKRSEKRAQDIEQLELWVEQLETVVADRSYILAQNTVTKLAPSSPKPRREFPAHLARETQTIAPHQSCCPDCGGNLKHLGDDISEMLELEPVRSKLFAKCGPSWLARAAIPSCKRRHQPARSNAAWPEARS